MAFVSINPATEEVLQSYPEISDSHLNKTIESLQKSLIEWAPLDVGSRLLLLKNVFEKMKRNSSALAEMMSLEMGKPIEQSVAEVSKTLSLESFYDSVKDEILKSAIQKTPFGLAEIHKRPLGIIFGIMPWNFPVWQVFRFAIPTLLAGNSVAIKHAPNMQGVARLIESFFKPLPVYANLPIAEQKALKLIGDSRIRGVSLTGSARAGRAVAEMAGKHLKKSLLELGGSDPYIVLEDADVKQAASICAESRLLNAGQSCISAKRFIVVKSLARDFEEAFRSELQKYQPEDPLKSTSRLGPLARKDLRANLHRQVRRSLSKGAVLKLGGIVSKNRGYFYSPTLLTNVVPGMATFDEEVFGPVASVTVAKSETDAIILANTSHYGLGAALMTRDIEKAKRLAALHISSGMVGINMSIRSDPSLPFGGVKDSGYGRELGRYGPEEFTNTKVVMVS